MRGKREAPLRQQLAALYRVDVPAFLSAGHAGRNSPACAVRRDSSSGGGGSEAAKQEYATRKRSGSRTRSQTTLPGASITTDAALKDHTTGAAHSGKLGAVDVARTTHTQKRRAEPVTKAAEEGVASGSPRPADTSSRRRKQRAGLPTQQMVGGHKTAAGGLRVNASPLAAT